MNVLVTGAKGFIGKNLVAALKCLQNGTDRTRPELQINDIYEFDKDSDIALLSEYCKNADFVFNLAGVNRPINESEFISGNCDFASNLLNLLIKNGNKCPIMLSSSKQASLEGRYDGPYGRSKLKAEEIFEKYSKDTGAKVFIYRFPNVFGKWCRPNYNSAVATFCHNIANDMSITVNDRSTVLELIYIDDLVSEMLDILENKAANTELKGITHRVSLGEIVELLDSFAAFPDTLLMPEIAENTFAKKLYSTYLSYLPKSKIAFPLDMKGDSRGSFTELLKTEKCGQISVNVSLPGITKGEHWHNSKWELFIVVSGRGLIRQRKIGSDEIIETEVSGEKIEAVHMLTGYTHSVVNLSDNENLVTVMWANERFDPNHPDTFFERI